MFFWFLSFSRLAAQGTFGALFSAILQSSYVVRLLSRKWSTISLIIVERTRYANPVGCRRQRTDYLCVKLEFSRMSEREWQSVR